MNFDFPYMLGVIPQILVYLPVTLLISLLSILLATVLGIIFALLLRAGKIPAAFAHLYISFFRGTPVLVQLLIIYFGLPQIIPSMNSLSAMNAVILGLSLNTSAYLAEIFRAAIDSVDKGQLEASLASGLSMFKASSRILFPQACRNAIPAQGAGRGSWPPAPASGRAPGQICRSGGQGRRMGASLTGKKSAIDQKIQLLPA